MGYGLWDISASSEGEGDRFWKLGFELMLTVGLSTVSLIFSGSTEDCIDVLLPSFALVLRPVIDFLKIDDSLPLSLPLPLLPDLLLILL